MSSYTLKLELLDKLDYLTKNNNIYIDNINYNKIVRLGFLLIDVYLEEHSSKVFPNMLYLIKYIVVFLGIDLDEQLFKLGDQELKNNIAIDDIFHSAINKNRLTHIISKL